MKSQLWQGDSRAPLMRPRLIPPAASAFVLAVALNSCGGGDSSGPPAPASVASVEISASAVTISVSQTVRLIAATKDANGNVLTGRAVTWSTADGTIATVDIYGVVSAVGVGATTITATSEGKLAYASVTVITDVAYLVISPARPNLYVGQTVQLTATTTNASGNTLTGRTVSWSTSSAATATVSASGLLTAVALGPAIITATSDGVTATATINVVDVLPLGRRATFDRPDEALDVPVFKIVYLTTADGPDRGVDTTGVLENSVGSSQNWLASKTGKIFRLDTYQGRPDILYFKLSKTEAELAGYGRFVLDPILHELFPTSFNHIDPNKRYLFYYEGTMGEPQVCGGGILNGPAGILFLKADNCVTPFVTSPTAPPNLFEFVMVHESFHVRGIVAPKAPRYDVAHPAGHLNDPNDIMHWELLSPTVIDSCGCNYYGDGVPAGVTNLKNDPILIPASAAVLANARLQTQAPRERPQAAFPHGLHDVLLELPRR
jgi:hypothetical protein